MKTHILYFALALAVMALGPPLESRLLAQGQDEKTVKEELKRLQGVWKPVSIEHEGKEYDFKTTDWQMKINGDKIAHVENGRALEGRVEIASPTKTSKRAYWKYTNADVNNSVIFFFVNPDTLVTCWRGRDANIAEWPTGFATGSPETGVYLAVWKRAQDETDAITPLHHIRWAEGAPGESPRFTSIDLTPDGRYFLASRANHKTRVWNTKTGELVRELPGYIARLSQDGTQVIRTGGISGVNDFHVHDLATGKELREFDAQLQIYNFWLPPTGTRLCLVSPQSAQVWDWSTGKKLCDVPWTLADQIGLAPDGRHLFLRAGGKPPLVVFDTETGKPVKDVYQSLRDLPHLGGLTADGKRMLTGDDKTPIKVYDVATGKELPSLEGKPTTGQCTISADGRRVLAAGNERKTFGLWDVETGRLLKTLRFPEEIDGSWNYRLSYDGEYAVVCSTDSVYVFRLASPAKKKDEAKKELEKLQGTWALFSFEVEGTQIGPRDKRETLTIQGDTWIIKGEVIESGTIKFAKAPNCFDLVRTGENFKGKTTQAIFQVDGDTLRFCAHGRENQALPRPTSFTTKAGDQTFLAVYKRVASIVQKAEEAAAVQAVEKLGGEVTRDAEAIEKVVRSYLGNQCKPSACEQNIGLCLEDAVHSVIWKNEGKVNRATIREVVEFAKKTFTEDKPTTVESVKVEVYAKTGLAVAFVQFHHVGVNCHDVITLTLRDGTWKIVSIVQENMEPK